MKAFVSSLRNPWFYALVLLPVVFGVLPMWAPAPPPTPSSAIPIDGGASILAAGAAAYGARKIYAQYRKRKEGNNEAE